MNWVCSVQTLLGFLWDLTVHKEATFWSALIFEVNLHPSGRLADVQQYPWFSEVYVTQGENQETHCGCISKLQPLVQLFASYYFIKLMGSCPSVWFLHLIISKKKFYFTLKQKYLLNWCFFPLYQIYIIFKLFIMKNLSIYKSENSIRKISR